MSNRHVVTAAVVVCAVSVLVMGTARAQDRDPAAAQALFDEARKLMDAQRYAEACPKLAESQRLDPGIGTQFHLASCYEHAGKLASAWATFLEVASVATASGQTDRARAASRRASLLEPRLSRMKIVVPAASRAPGLEITRDGVAVGVAQWDVALPVDAGDHHIEVTAPDKRSFAAPVRVAEGATVSFEVPPLESAVAAAPEAATRPTADATEAPAPSPAPVAAAPQPAPSPAPADTTRSTSSAGPGALVIGLGIVGVVGVGAGAVLGMVARSKNEDSKDHCDPMHPNQCSSRGVALRNDAYTFSDVATAAFITGGAALATAAVLWLLRGGSESADESAAISVHPGPTAASFAVSGKF
jgi:serine/threonine-protein kinase